MRTGLLITLGLIGLIIGGTCLPLVDNTDRQPIAGQSLGIAIGNPAEEETVLQGNSVPIEWSASNLTDEPATVSLVVESRLDLSITTLVEGIELDGTGDSGEYQWDTTAFTGPYALIARIQTPSLFAEDTANGLITVDAPPTFAFTAPATDATWRPGETLTITWTGGDAAGTVQIGLDPDAEHVGTDEDDDGEDPDRNEIIIAARDLPDPAAQDSLDWNGNDTDGVPVAFGTYYLFAIASDGAHDDLIVDASGLITVAEAESDDDEEDDEPTGPAVLQPADDAEFLTIDDSLAIEYQVDQSADVLVDVKIDTDDNHANGNEQTIQAQQFVEAESEPDTFAWDGMDAAGNPVADGIYRVFLVVSQGSATPLSADAAGLVFRRSATDQPLIALLAPAAAQTVSAGEYVLLEWRDDAPDGGTIRITLDDDPDPNEGEVDAEGDLAEIVVLTDRDAAGDDVQDTFSWQVSNSLSPGTYYVFAYIDADDDGVAEHVSVAPAVLIVSDPANP